MSTQDEKRFPMLNSPSVPWSWGVQFYALYASVFGTHQDIDTIARRGGLGWSEIELCCKKYERETGKIWKFTEEKAGV